MGEKHGEWHLEHSDSACPPGTVGGLRLNSTSVWARRGKTGTWRRTDHRSMFAARKAIEGGGSPEFGDGQ